MMTGNRIMSLFSVLAVQVAGLGVLFFWVIGAVLRFFPNKGGQINLIQLEGLPGTVFFAYPALLAIFFIIGWLAYWRKSDLVAVGASSVPLGIMLFLYLYLILR
jgi:hypothetical protein